MLTEEELAARVRIKEEDIVRILNVDVNRLDKLFEVIDQCNGKVELVGDDIRLNLKSKLAQYFSLAKIFSDGSDEIQELQIVAEDPDDTQKLINFMMQ